MGEFRFGYSRLDICQEDLLKLCTTAAATILQVMWCPWREFFDNSTSSPLAWSHIWAGIAKSTRKNQWIKLATGMIDYDCGVRQCNENNTSKSRYQTQAVEELEKFVGFGSCAPTRVHQPQNAVPDRISALEHLDGGDCIQHPLDASGDIQ
ncbi:hypothetical protein BDZ89DRAFT_1129585 [Hymenopellis radicata]|nr:hypothetical protein BDZ89DRAFT_1129585 [Hymenopellis radicata]